MNINSNRTNKCDVPPYIILLKEQITSVVFLPEMCNLNLIMRKHQTKLN